MLTEYFDSISSTNDYLFANALSGVFDSERAVYAGEQTAGKGRRGRSFFSPKETGLYLSILLFPKCDIEKTRLLTTLMAVASAKALRELTSKDIGIKWVNDLYLDGKKISGILTECSLGVRDNIPDFVVVGIGINIISPDGGFPDDIKNKAGAIYDNLPEENGPIAEFRRTMAQRIISGFETLYAGFPDNSCLEEYKRLDILSGKRVLIAGGDTVTVAGIKDDFGLEVIHDDGHMEVLTAGEVSLIL